MIEANYIHKKDDVFDNFKLTEEDEHIIRKLAKDDKIGEKVYSSQL